MSDTPRMKAAQMAAMEHGTGDVYRVGCDIELELNAANKRLEEIEKSGVYEGRPIDKTYLTIHSDVLGTMVSEKAYDPQAKIRELQDRIKRLEEAVEAYRTAYTPDGHVAPHDCFATGPKTGNPIEDLVACPGCWAERKAKEAKL